MLDVAIEAAKQAGALAYSYFKKQSASWRIGYKADNSPVTIADIETEKLIRKIITKNFPDHGIIGEELENINPKAKYQWVIDPIDGTKSFIRGMPFWSTLLAVLEDNKPIIGILFSPAFNQLFVAQKGKGAYLNNKRTHVSRISELKYAYLVHGSIHYFERLKKLKNLVALYNSVSGHRGFGDAFAYSLLVSGKVDIMVEALALIEDHAATSLLVEEAGGKYTDFSGKFSLTSGAALATNGLLHDQVLKILNS